MRRRETLTGTVSTTLVQSYRDERGRPRQRILANLFGEPDTLSAVAKLAVQRSLLNKEKAKLEPNIEAAQKFYEMITMRTLSGHRFKPAERKEIDQLLRDRKGVLKRAAKVDADLAKIQRHGAVLKKHCFASPDEIQRAIRKHQKLLSDAEAGLLGAEYIYDSMKAKLRRMSL